LVKKITSKVILGNPFLALFHPFEVSAKGINTKNFDQNICFEFLTGATTDR
jgi:hypothetical protein